MTAGPHSSAMSVMWQLRERKDAGHVLRVRGLGQPAQGGTTSDRESNEEWSQPRDVTAGGRAVGDDQHGHDAASSPSEAPRENRRDANLHVEPAEKILDVDDGCLDLDDEKDSAARVEREQIDPSSIAVVVEAHLSSDIPTEGPQAFGPYRGERRVVRIKEPFDFGPLPADVPSQREVHRGGDPARGPHCQL